MKFSTHIMVCSLAMVALLMTSSLTGAVLPKTSDTMRFQDGRIVYVEKFHCYAIQPVSILLPLWCLGTKDHPNVSLSYVFYLYPVNLLEAYKVDGLQVRFKACPVASFCAPFPFAHVVLLLAIERGDGAGDDTIGKIPCYPEARWNAPPFELVYQFGVGEQNILDTARHLYTKDMVCEPSINYDMRLTTLEKNVIYRAIMDNDLFNIKENFTQNCDENGNCLTFFPSVSARLTIIKGGITKTIAWRDVYFNTTDPDLQKFLNVKNVIESIIKEKEIELGVEQPSCGYL